MFTMTIEIIKISQFLEVMVIRVVKHEVKRFIDITLNKDEYHEEN